MLFRSQIHRAHRAEGISAGRPGHAGHADADLSTGGLCGAGAITRRMAESLYVAMMTDTGNFAFSFLTPELFRAVAVLVEKGISIPDIHNSVYNAYTEGRARLFGYAINRKMEVIQDGTVAYMDNVIFKVYILPCQSDRKSTRLNSSHRHTSRMPSSA